MHHKAVYVIRYTDGVAMLNTIRDELKHDTEWLAPHRIYTALLPSQCQLRPFSSEWQVFSEGVQIMSSRYYNLEA